MSGFMRNAFAKILEFKGYYGKNDPLIELIEGEVNGPIRRNDKVYISVYHYLEFKNVAPSKFDTNGIGKYFASICDDDFILITYKLKNGKIQTTKRYDYNFIERNKETFKKFRK